MQSQAQSLRESVAQTVVGFALNQVVLFFIFPGSIIKNLALSLLMTGLSFPRQYIVRRYFNQGVSMFNLFRKSKLQRELDAARDFHAIDKRSLEAARDAIYKLHGILVFSRGAARVTREQWVALCRDALGYVPALPAELNKMKPANPVRKKRAN
ncbi:MAG: hypothetical protein KGL39_29270, partial [Patescibacteria group bacterium]|nr:hypothetical protein [Patescibacteria group bacterium]